jgi:hypothetical protein
MIWWKLLPPFSGQKMQAVDKYNLLNVKHIKIEAKICQEYSYGLNWSTINYLFWQA